MSNVPKLRFKEFSEEWKSKKIKELTNYVDYRGKTPTKTETGVFLVTAKNIKQGFIDYTSSQEYISTDDYEEVMRRGKPLKGDVLLTTEAPLGNIAQIDREDIALAQRVIKFRGNELLDNGFLKHYMLGNKFQRLLEIKAIGTTVLGIQGKVLHSLPLTIPIKQEQEKIASFLTSVDTKIEQLTKKEELLRKYKKGVMQKIFNREIRFKDDTGSEFCEWKEKKLDEVANRYDNLRIPVSSSNRISGDTPYYGANGIQDYVEGFTHDGEFVLLAEDGANDLQNYPVRYVNGKIWVNNHAHVLQGKKNILNNKFFGYSISKINIEPFLVGGGRAKLNANILMKININIPSIQEQTKIANFLSLIDSKIEQVQKQLNYIKEFKKALLQQMFV